MNIKWSEISTKDDSCISVLDVLERQSTTIRSEYFSWLFELGNKYTAGVTTTDCFLSSDGMSFWWMSLLVEKSPFKSTSVFDCLKLLALEKILIHDQLSEIKVIGTMSVSVKSAIAALCENRGVKVELVSSVDPKKMAFNAKALYMKIPHVVRGATVLARRMFSCWKLRTAKVADWFSGEDTVFLMSYFIHLDKAAYQEGRFKSHLWGSLPEMLVSSGKSLNWLHHFIAHKHIPNTASGLKWISSFNQNTEQKSKHSFTDSYLTISIVVRAVVRWLGFIWKSWKVRDIKKHFQPDKSTVNFWPILKSDWYNSFIGAAAAQNILWYELFDKAMASIPKQSIGLYLYEGQSWEPAFVHAWRKHGHGKLIAVVHSTIRYWDLRHFADTRIFDPQFKDFLALPDKIAVNGLGAREGLLNADYPEEYLVDVEAMRYLHLSSELSLEDNNQSVGLLNKKIRLLVLGDIQAVNNHPLFELLAGLPMEQKNRLKITVKPHPGNHVAYSDYADVDYEVTTCPLMEIMGEFDLAFGANQTSANLDIYLSGLAVIVYRDIASLNFSPLKDIADVRFVSTSDELAIMLNSEDGAKRQINPCKDYFYLDANLPKWKKLLLEKNEE